MFDNVLEIIPVYFLKEDEKTQLNSLIAHHVIPIGIVLEGVKSYFDNKEVFTDILPSIIYKENYRA